MEFSCIQTRKRGILFCKNARNGSWEPYKCTLTNEKMIFVKLPEHVRTLSVSSLSFRGHLNPDSQPASGLSTGAASNGALAHSRQHMKNHQQSSFTEEWAIENFADFEQISSRFAGSLPDMLDKYSLELEHKVNCAEIEKNPGNTEIPFLIRIENRQTLLYAGTMKIEEANEWKQAINDVTKSVRLLIFKKQLLP